MYKELFGLVAAIITQPGKTWKALADKEEKGDEFLSRFVYPLIGMVAAAAFIGILFTEKKFDAELALKSSIKALISVFGGFYLASYLLNEAWKGLFKRKSDLKLCQRFAGYASAMPFALRIIMPFLSIPDFFFMRILMFYTVYIIWEGAPPYMRVGERLRMRFVVIASALIIFVPAAINLLLFMLMPGMRI
ncbi:MAG: DUF1282 domain-containing protein [Bacteroidales bacterium]